MSESMPPTWALFVVGIVESQRSWSGPDDYRTQEQLVELAGVIAQVPRCETCGWWNFSQQRDGVWGECSVLGRSSQVTLPCDERWLLTRGDFGCVQWEPQGEERPKR